MLLFRAVHAYSDVLVFFCYIPTLTDRDTSKVVGVLGCYTCHVTFLNVWVESGPLFFFFYPLSFFSSSLSFSSSLLLVCSTRKDRVQILPLHATSSLRVFTVTRATMPIRHTHPYSTHPSLSPTLGHRRKQVKLTTAGTRPSPGISACIGAASRTS